MPTKTQDWKCATYRGSVPSAWLSNSFDDSSWAYASKYTANGADNIWYRVAGRTYFKAVCLFVWQREKGAYLCLL